MHSGLFPQRTNSQMNCEAAKESHHVLFSAYRFAAQRSRSGAKRPASTKEKAAAAANLANLRASVRGFQQRGHLVQGGVGVGDDGGVLHVFRCGDWSLFALLPTKQSVEKKMQNKRQVSVTRIKPHDHFQQNKMWHSG